MIGGSALGAVALCAPEEEAVVIFVPPDVDFIRQAIFTLTARLAVFAPLTAERIYRFMADKPTTVVSPPYRRTPKP